MKRRHSLMLPESRETMKGAVRRHCLDCAGAWYDPIKDRYYGPEKCESMACPLYPYAFRTNKWLRLNSGGRCWIRGQPGSTSYGGDLRSSSRMEYTPE